MSDLKEGDKVTWKWGEGEAGGTVKSIFPEKTVRTIDGNEVTRNGTQDDPALYIENDGGNNVLKLASEVERVG